MGTENGSNGPKDSGFEERHPVDDILEKDEGFFNKAVDEYMKSAGFADDQRHLAERWMRARIHTIFQQLQPPFDEEKVEHFRAMFEESGFTSKTSEELVRALIGVRETRAIGTEKEQVQSITETFGALRSAALAEMEANEEEFEDNIHGVVMQIREQKGEEVITPASFAAFTISLETAYDEVYEFIEEGLQEFFTAPSGPEGMEQARTIANGYLVALGISEDTAQKIVDSTVKKFTQ